MTSGQRAGLVDTFAATAHCLRNRVDSMHDRAIVDADRQAKLSHAVAWSTRGFAALLIIAIAAQTSACGTVFYGRTQTIAVMSTPPGATASLAGDEITTPGTIEMQRNQPKGWVVARATYPGYQPACTVVPGRFNVKYLILDALGLAIPMLIDVIGMGSLNALREYPSQVNLVLQPLAAGESPRLLPTDEEIIALRRRTWVDLCQPNDLRRVAGATTRCFATDALIENAGADERTVHWTYRCSGVPYSCASDRRLQNVVCSESAP